MGNHRATPNSPATNEGKNDDNRGKTARFDYSEGQRKTGKVGGAREVENPLKVGDGNIRRVKDPRLA